jgi:hypothetical protein
VSAVQIGLTVLVPDHVLARHRIRHVAQLEQDALDLEVDALRQGRLRTAEQHRVALAASVVGVVRQ